jgi:phage N-6-adenine-methyltransferase
MNSSEQQSYETPWSHVRAVERDSFGGVPFALDAAATIANRKASRHYDTSTNGLSSRWIDGTWCNPPYEHQGEWLARAVYWARQGVHSASLVLASTSAKYWRPCAHEAGTIDYYEGRIAFVDPATGLPRPNFDRASALVLLGPRFAGRTVRYRDARSGELIGATDQVSLL